MISIFQSIILGIVEGIAEFLPISSTGHLILTTKLLDIQSTDYVKSFEIIIQLGAILAVMFFYGKRLIVDRECLKKVIFAFIPTGIIGFSIYKIAKQFLLGNYLIVVASLLIGGLLMILVENNLAKATQPRLELSQMSRKHAIYIGVIQSLSIIPGVSRSAATIIGGTLLGYDRKAIVEFSFLLAIPTMLAATGYDLLKSASSFSSDQFIVLLIGFVVSFFAAAVSIKWLMKYINSHNFVMFGIYRIVLAVAFYLYIL